MNGMTAGAQAVLERKYGRDKLCAAAHGHLRSEFLRAAISMEPMATVDTPAYDKQKQQPLYEVIFDSAGDVDLVEIARLMLKVAHGDPITPEMRLSANVLIAQIANRHANVHEAATADAMEE